MELDLERVRKNVAAATMEDLLDRATVFRAGMEPTALEIIDAELRRRSVTADDIQAHWENRRANVLTRDGTARRCDFCDRPAITRDWGWHWVWGTFPLFPRLFLYCEVHKRE